MNYLLKQVAAEVRTEELKIQLRKVGSAFLNHREVSTQEAMTNILLTQSSTAKLIRILKRVVEK